MESDLPFAATVHAALQTGATPVLVDVDSDCWCIDPPCVEKAITPKTRAIVAVHLYGHPANMSALRVIADKHSIELIEDAAEAHGADINGVRVGSLSRVGAFSFYGNKTITTGEGGAFTTNDDVLAQPIRFLKDHGMSKNRRYLHTELAFNCRMTNLQAALGVAQVEQLDAFIEKKRTIMKWYRREPSCLILNPEHPGCHSTFWMMCALLDFPVKASRDDVCAMLRDHNIDTRPFFVPMSQMPHLQGLRQVGRDGDSCPVSLQVSERGINLPSGCSLTEQQVVRVCKSLRAVLE